MQRLFIIQGKNAGHSFPIEAREMLIGRVPPVDICLEGKNVSRRHARVWREKNGVFVEDAGSSNGTFVNDAKISGPVLLAPNDLLRIGSYALRFESDRAEADLTIQRQTIAQATNIELFRENAAHKLQAVIELARHLTNSLETSVLLERLVKQLLALFSNSERAMVISFAGGEPSILALSERKQRGLAGAPFSRSILRKVFEKRMSVLAEDATDSSGNLSLNALGIRSVMCVPLVGHGNRVFGAIQLDRFDFRQPFTPEDLHLLTTIALQVSTVLENAELHQELVIKERLVRELALAREIQQAFLPSGFPAVTAGTLELHGELHPAYEVAGDFYDYLALDDHRLLLVVGDVSGKGMAAALFMTMVRALLRQLALQCASPSAILERLNDALTRDNPKFMFVTLILGICEVSTGECLLARAGHPAALLRKHRGETLFFDSPPGCLLGIEAASRPPEDRTVQLEPGDTLFLYTDGITEAATPDSGQMFGEERLLRAFQQLPASAPLGEWSSSIRSEVAAFSKGAGPQDDLTLLFLKRPER